jgi:hypothetical protein
MANGLVITIAVVIIFSRMANNANIDVAVRGSTGAQDLVVSDTR